MRKYFNNFGHLAFRWETVGQVLISDAVYSLAIFQSGRQCPSMLYSSSLNVVPAMSSLSTSLGNMGIFDYKSEDIMSVIISSKRV